MEEAACRRWHKAQRQPYARSSRATRRVQGLRQAFWKSGWVSIADVRAWAAGRVSGRGGESHVHTQPGHGGTGQLQPRNDNETVGCAEDGCCLRHNVAGLGPPSPASCAACSV